MNAVVPVQPRLAMPAIVAAEMDVRKWRVLCEATFPNAKSAESIVMAIDYCRARGLDVFKKPVHIVPMWNSTLGREVETVWPGINEIQVTASRTGQWAGMDEPKWGPDKTVEFTGRRKGRQGWEDGKISVTFPEWCSVRVYRMVGGAPRAFTEPVYWLEAYSTAGGRGSRLPTDMWVKRPRGQLHKVAKAASLRAAFPEEGEYTAEEMEGKEIDAGGIVIDHDSEAVPPPSRRPPPPAANPMLPPNGGDPETPKAEGDAAPSTQSPAGASDSSLSEASASLPEHDAVTGEIIDEPQMDLAVDERTKRMQAAEKSLEDAAKQGTAALKAGWGNLDRDERKHCRALLDRRLKAIAEEVDAMIDESPETEAHDEAVAD